MQDLFQQQHLKQARLCSSMEHALNSKSRIIRSLSWICHGIPYFGQLPSLLWGLHCFSFMRKVWGDWVRGEGFRLLSDLAGYLPGIALRVLQGLEQDNGV